MKKVIIIIAIFYVNLCYALSSEQAKILERILLLESDRNRPSEIELVYGTKIPIKDIREFFHKTITETQYDKTFKNNDLYVETRKVNGSLFLLREFGNDESLKIIRPFWQDTDKDNRLKSTAIYSSIEISNFDKNLIKEILDTENIGTQYYGIAEDILEQYKKNQKYNSHTKQMELLNLLKYGLNIEEAKERFLSVFKDQNFDLNGEIEKLKKEIDEEKENGKSQKSGKEKDLVNPKGTERQDSTETGNQDSIKTESSSSISLNAENSKSKISIIFGVLFTIILGGFAICKTRKNKNRKQEEK